MSIHIRAIVLAATAAMAAGSATAFADVNFYAGLGVGGARLEQDVDITFTAYDYDQFGQLGELSSATLNTFKGSDVAYRIFAGVRFARYLGWEIGYVNLGEPEDSLGLSVPAVNSDDPDQEPIQDRPVIDTALKLTNQIDGLEGYVLGALPFLNKWEAFAKLGLIHWKSKFTVRNYFSDTYPPSPPQPGSENPEDIPTFTPTSSVTRSDGTDLAGGIGVNYKASEHLTMRGEGTWYDIEDTKQAWQLGFNLIYDF